MPEFHKAFDRISCDFGLLVSNDGVKFREPVKGYRFLRRDESLVTPVPGHNFNTILCQANGILIVGDETRIYHGRWRNADGRGENDALKYYYAEVALATLPRDRWGALGLNPGEHEGSVWTAPLTICKRGCEVSLNADGVQGICVEVADEQFRPLPKFSGENAGRIVAKDGLACAVAWSKVNLDKLVGKTVRLKIHLRKGEHAEPRLYAAYVSCD